MALPGRRVPASLIFTLALLALPAPGLVARARAQVVTNPRVVEFDPSPDHNVVLDDGRPAVTRYDFEMYLAGAVAPFHVVSLGKPSPGTDGKVRHDFSSQVTGWPLPGGTYESRVAAIGPNGAGRSDVSNQFTFDAPCTWTVSATAVTASASGGPQHVTVTTAAGCAWSVSTTASWITPATTSGTGSGTAGFSVAANAAGSSRTGTLTVAGTAVTVTQSGVVCTYSVTPTSQSVAPSGGTGSFSVTAPAGCGWTATKTAAWLTVTAGASGTGNGTVSFSASANADALGRTASITVPGQTFTITQAGAIVVPGAPRNLRITGSH